MKSPKQAHLDDINRINKIINKSYNPNRDKLGRFTFGITKAKKQAEVSDSEIVKFAQTIENEKTDAKKGDNMLQQIYQRQGFNKKPKTITKKQYIDTYEGTKVYRGIEERNSKVNYAKEFINGNTHFAGQGIFGNGTYMTTSKNDAFDYAGDKGSILDIIIPANAKLINQQVAAREANHFADGLIERGMSMQSLARKNKDMKLAKDARSLIDIGNTFRDPGIYAASQGYDGMFVKNAITLQNVDADHYIMFNRGILTVNKEISSF